MNLSSDPELQKVIQKDPSSIRSVPATSLDNRDMGVDRHVSPS